jgi:hypothetical protein
MRKSITYAVLILSLTLSGCAAGMLIGDAVRSGQEDYRVAIPPTSSVKNINKTNKVAINLRGIGENGSYLFYGTGTTNKAIYSDRLELEMIGNGFNVTALSSGNTVEGDQSKLDSLARNNVAIVLEGNLNMGSSTSYGSAVTGGNYMDTGITDFSVKAIDTNDGSVMFIISGEYGKAKEASRITKDITMIYGDILAGDVEKYGVKSLPTAEPQKTTERSSPPAKKTKIEKTKNTQVEDQQPGNGGDDVQWVQSTLNDLGYKCGTADGVMGANTRTCIRSFQKENDLRATGSVNETTYKIILTKIE